jgi:hypothetical protein
MDVRDHACAQEGESNLSPHDNLLCRLALKALHTLHGRVRGVKPIRRGRAAESIRAPLFALSRPTQIL